MLLQFVLGDRDEGPGRSIVKLGASTGVAANTAGAAAQHFPKVLHGVPVLGEHDHLRVSAEEVVEKSLQTQELAICAQSGNPAQQHLQLFQGLGMDESLQLFVHLVRAEVDFVGHVVFIQKLADSDGLVA